MRPNLKADLQAIFIVWSLNVKKMVISNAIKKIPDECFLLKTSTRSSR